MSSGPLAGVRVVELAGLGPAPFACMMLAELGVNVVKVDRPGATGLGIPPAYDLLSRFCDVYETSDGGYLAVGPLESRFYAEFLWLLGVAEALPQPTDRLRWGEMRAAIASRIKTLSQVEWSEIFADSDACVTPVLPMSQAPNHIQMAARGS
ncbi:MAG: CoA transferase [Nocardioidaceae bacterium]